MSSVILARKGRLRQRYDDNYRLVAGCIPYRVTSGNNDACSSIDRLEVLMISTPNRTDLVFPKGGWEDDETVYEAACREAYEEAGVRGILDTTQLGLWFFRSKSSQNSCSPGGGCKGYIFALQVTEELEYWPEQATHGRRWVTVNEAFQLCRYEWMREVLQKFLERVGFETSTQELTEPSISLYSVLPPTPERAMELC